MRPQSILLHLLNKDNFKLSATDAIRIHKHLPSTEPVKLSTYISTMLEQDLHSLILVLGGGQVQRCSNIIDWVHINTLGQQQPYSLEMPWRHNETQQGTSGRTGDVFF